MTNQEQHLSRIERKRRHLKALREKYPIKFESAYELLHTGECEEKGQKVDQMLRAQLGIKTVPRIRVIN